ncbi:MAG: hypothetical protein GY879_10560, partial [Planctomycetes bacterium]|nr:hypothetical protein [Planctomycetota bacterium]
MRRDLEALPNPPKDFALFPEASASRTSYVTLDATCVAYLYRILHPHSFREKGKRPEKTRVMKINDVVALHAEEIFDYLFDLKRIRCLRRTHHFRFSFQTDGVGVVLGFGHWHRYVPSQSKKETEAPVTSLANSIAYHYRHKTLGVQGFK